MHHRANKYNSSNKQMPHVNMHYKAKRQNSLILKAIDIDRAKLLVLLHKLRCWWQFFTNTKCNF